MFSNLSAAERGSEEEPIPPTGQVQKALESLHGGGDTVTAKLRPNGNGLQAEGKALAKARESPQVSHEQGPGRGVDQHHPLQAKGWRLIPHFPMKAASCS